MSEIKISTINVIMLPPALILSTAVFYVIILGIIVGVVLAFLFGKVIKYIPGKTPSVKGIVTGALAGLLFVYVFPEGFIFAGGSIITLIVEILISLMSGYFLGTFYERFNRKREPTSTNKGKKPLKQ